VHLVGSCYTDITRYTVNKNTKYVIIIFDIFVSCNRGIQLCGQIRVYFIDSIMGY